MKIKKPALLSMQLALSLLIMAEILLLYTLSWGLGALLHACFDISFNLSGTVWAFLLSVIVGGAVAHYLGKWLFTPILRLGEAMGQVAGGNFDVRLDEGSGFREIREINKNFNIMAKELGATEILQTDFVTNVSHEFKTPINAIEGYTMLLQGTGEGTPEQREYVEKILHNTRRLSSLIGDILLLSKVENQTIAREETEFRLDEQVRQSILSLEPQWSEKETDFDVELEEISYRGDERLLLHVWNNLIGNAVKFNPPNAAVRLRLSRSDGGVIFTVEDEGPGIPPEAQKHIFDKFYQGDSSHREEGNGLGLALVKRILNVCGGEIAQENLPGRGCRFTVRLPEN